MVGQPEVPNYDTTVYQLEITDPVQGGRNGVANASLLNLANRTNWLKQQLSLLISGALIPPTLAPLNGPAFTGSVTAPNVAPGDNSNLIANTNFVQTRQNGLVVVPVGGNANIVLQQNQWGVGILIFTGTLTGPVSVLFPAQPGMWQVANRATGAFPLTCGTTSGTGVVISQTIPYAGIWCDGANIFLQDSLGFSGVSRAGSFGPSGSLGPVGVSSWTVPADVVRLRIRVWGAGGGGGGSTTGQGAGGGGSGGYAEGVYPVTPGQVLTINAGAGGAGAPAGGLGAFGGTTSVTGIIQAGGGSGGVPSPTSAGGLGGPTTAGNILNLIGGQGMAGSSATGGAGAGSPMGGPGAASGPSTPGSSAGAPGGGGAGYGPLTAGTGTSGAAGVVIFDW